ncbi:NAD-dependent epimerase/dehydratase family protein [Crassaminicella indica]|uniref:SDR family oxidoreductase n=1 Tax=Crassaminicella indica TaxID=2855394 RepID=A0ABX8RF84_9CLOT|nr:NAD-dependent epimerase/dehydratase family protein [Crassaminicella indica]QXM07471.1 SDR family oxidoreductase [Crassaminicella indica]
MTGATGFLGSYMAKELIGLGANVTALVRAVEEVL